MPTTRKQTSTRKNSRAASSSRGHSNSSRKSTSSQAKGRSRAKPGERSSGSYFHIEVRPRRQFKTFRTQDVGKPGGIQRVAGRRSSGSWDTQKWLISKDMAHAARGKLVADSRDARKVLDDLGSAVTHVTGDRYKAGPRRSASGNGKPTLAQARARRSNTRKPQRARRKG
jgi:hypothetical protein